MIKIFTVKIHYNNNVILKEFQSETLISSILEECEIKQDKPCGGKGKCKKCLVELNGQKVLSCCTTVKSDCEIKILSEMSGLDVLTEGRAVINAKNPIINDGFGAAVDIGTTTIAAYIYKFPECKCVEKLGERNLQAQFGADVVSRLEYANKGGLKKLKNTVTTQIDDMLKGYDISALCITGNTTMLHFYKGLNTSEMSVSPFKPTSLFGYEENGVYIPGCISAYVGADITTAILAADLDEDKVSFLVDIGTNGEMALFSKGRYICCSTAAGPAFEGAGISSGMAAAEGAINKVWIENNEIKYCVTGNIVPKGICSSGLIDAVAVMLEMGVIDETGYMENPFYIGDSNISITPDDIRQVQLAKSAIRSGIDTLLYECNISCEEIDDFYIAGGFGSFLDKQSAARIGLIPYEVLDKITVLGNAAGNGASMILCNKENWNKVNEITYKAETLELSQSSVFMDKYIENMMF